MEKEGCDSEDRVAVGKRGQVVTESRGKAAWRGFALVYCISGHLLEGCLRGSAPAYTCLDCASPMSALAACSMFAFRVMHAVLPMHMDVQHVLPARDLPFTPLCPCQVFVGAFEQLSVREYKEELTQASSLVKHLWSQYLRAGKGYVQIHTPFPPSSDRAQCCVAGRGFAPLIA